MPKIVGIGDSSIDIILGVPYLPSRDGKVRAELISRLPGGVVSNFCAAATAYGADVGAVCKVGDDDYGKIALDDLSGRGVDISHMVVEKGGETYFCVIMLDDSGEKSLAVVVTSAFLPKPEEIDYDYLMSAERVHMTTLGMDLVDGVSERLAGTDVKLSLDIEPTASSWDPELWNRVLPRLDIALPNEAGLAALTGTDDVDAGAKILLEKGVKTVVVTCGSSGSRIYNKDGVTAVPAYKVDVVDSTGAGDCFNAAFLSGLTFGWDMKKSAEHASAAAAISIGSIGARGNLPSLEDTIDFMEKHSL